mmetsp:Transcript_8837/g.15190  ORF Transcript_8837/g.15190 Transcript_8837/m.15190 type:complete len:434 (-) Transcript_8837:428-1729(-)
MFAALFAHNASLDRSHGVVPVVIPEFFLFSTNAARSLPAPIRCASPTVMMAYLNISGPIIRLHTTTAMRRAPKGGPQTGSWAVTLLMRPSATPACVTYASHATFTCTGGHPATLLPSPAPTNRDPSRTSTRQTAMCSVLARAPSWREAPMSVKKVTLMSGISRTSTCSSASRSACTRCESLLLAAYRPMMTHASSGSHPANFAMKKHPVAISSSATHFTLASARKKGNLGFDRAPRKMGMSPKPQVTPRNMEHTTAKIGAKIAFKTMKYIEPSSSGSSPFSTNLIASKFNANSMMTTTSFIMTTLSVKEQKGPRPSTSFSTAMAVAGERATIIVPAIVATQSRCSVLICRMNSTCSANSITVVHTKIQENTVMDNVMLLTATNVFRISSRCISLPAEKAMHARLSLSTNLMLSSPFSSSTPKMKGPLKRPAIR